MFKLFQSREERSGNTLYQEFSFQDPELVEDQAEITGENNCWKCHMECKKKYNLILFLLLGSWVHPGEYASSGNSILQVLQLSSYLFSASSTPNWHNF